MIEYFYENSVLIALLWMLAANLIAVGPNVLKTPCLVVMLLTWGPMMVGE